MPSNFISEYYVVKDEIRIKILQFLEKKLLEKFDRKNEIVKATQNIVDKILKNLESWLESDIPNELKANVMRTIKKEQWLEIMDAFYQDVSFGTSSCREKMTISLSEKNAMNDLKLLQKNKFDADILYGPNTINQITIARLAYGLLKYMKNNNLKKIVVGFDSRVLSSVFAKLVANIFLNEGFIVYLFNQESSTPELAFTVKKLNADMGVEITASHNDKRFNGFKIVTKSSGPPNVKERKEISKTIIDQKPIMFSKLKNFQEVKDSEKKSKKLFFLDTKKSKSKFHSINIHKKYVSEILSLISKKRLINKYAPELKIGYSSIHGTGYSIISNIFKEFGLKKFKPISNMIKPDPFFLCFECKQSLEPSNEKVSKIILDEFRKEYGNKELLNLDALFFTDPDSDRLGIICPVPKSEQNLYGKYKFVTANELWTVLLWYYLKNFFEKNEFKRNDRKNFFITKSFITSDSLQAVCKKFSIQCKEGGVGFTELVTLVQSNWKKGKINLGIFEESNGFTIAGNPHVKSPVKSHILEKDGILAAAMILELLAYCKSKDSTLLEVLNQIYEDPEIGYIINLRMQIPKFGSFDSIIDDFQKKQIMMNAEHMVEMANKQATTNNPYKIGGHRVLRAEKYSSGRYDDKYWKNFSDDGIRFFLDSKTNHVTVRSSGTESKVRIFIQYKVTSQNEKNLYEKKILGNQLVENIASDIEKKLKEFIRAN